MPPSRESPEAPDTNLRGAVLSSDAYPARVLTELRGTPWKELANAFRFLGQFPSALDALDHAEREFSRSKSPGLGFASAQYVRAFVRFEQEEYADAIILARSVQKAFAHAGETERYFAARLLEENILFEQSNFSAARVIFEEVQAFGETDDSSTWIARARQALGNCALGVNDTTAAADHFTAALIRFRNLGLTTEVIRCEWGMAR